MVWFFILQWAAVLSLACGDPAPAIIAMVCMLVAAVAS